MKVFYLIFLHYFRFQNLIYKSFTVNNTKHHTSSYNQAIELKLKFSAMFRIYKKHKLNYNRAQQDMNTANQSLNKLNLKIMKRSTTSAVIWHQR